MVEPPAYEARNEIERAADAAIATFGAALPAGALDRTDAHVILLGRVPGLMPDAVTAGSIDEDGDLLLILLSHATAVASSLGLRIHLVEVDKIGEG